MTVMIGHAGSNEYGGTHGGVPGDQTKTEVFIRSWYNRPWNVMFRPKDAKIAEKIAVAMEQACTNDNVGYNQNNRTSLYYAAKEKNWDISKITKKVDCDCSSLIAVCCNAAGLKVDKDNWTGVQRKNLQATGAFTTYTTSQYLTQDTYLRRGDILLYEGHHTAVVLSNGSNTKPAIDYRGKGIGFAVSLGSMHIRTGSSTSYPIVDTIGPGTKVEVLEVLANGWYKIVYPHITVGYAFVSNAGDGYFRYEPNPAANYRGLAIATTSMNVRTSNTIAGKILGTVSAGTKLNVIDIMPNKWYLVNWQGKEVYVSNANGKYFNFTANANYKWPQPVGKAKAYSSMNVRDFPKVIGSSVLGTISGGTVLDVLERLDNGWLRVKYAKAVGGWAYVSNAGNKFFQLIDNKS